MSSTLRRRVPLRSSRNVPRSKRVNLDVRGRCARCPRPATILQWCRGCAAGVADERVGAFVKNRDKACVRCGTTFDLTWAHILGRGPYPRLHWIEENTVACCWPCHALLDGNPDFKREFFEVLFPGRQEALRSMAERLPRPDLVSIIETYGSAA